MPQFVVFWTDALLFLLLAGAFGFAWHAARRPHLSEPWRRVGESRIGMVSAVVLSVYVVIGVLDSVHFRLPLPEAEQRPGVTHSTEILSLFDLLVTPLRENQEKTYSAPLAVRLFAKEAVQLADGATIREFPRLRHAGAGLAHPEVEHGADLLRTALAGLAQGLLATLVLWTVAIAWLARRRRLPVGAVAWALLRGRSRMPWREMLLAAGVILVLVGVAAELGTRYHLLGTDKVGEDVFYQGLKSIRTGLMIGVLTTLVMLPAAVVLGIMAGYFRGWVDDVIQYLYTTLNSIPGVLLIAAAVLMLQVYMSNHEADFTSLEERADLRLLFLCIILGITSWTGLCRLLRGETLRLREADYVQASQALGVGAPRILARHVLPNVLHIVLISIVLDFSGLVLAEAVLSYVNVGVDPTMNSWGNMINAARLELAREPVVWWSLAAAMVFMFVLVLAANLFADVVRDAFDPRLRGG